MGDDLFSSVEDTAVEAPLAYRMRPRTLDEYVGQDAVLGTGTALRKAIEEDKIDSLILYGPPGTGKTSLAAVIAAATSARWEELSAITAGVADVRKVIERARQMKGLSGKKTILFIDEIHRFSKNQQDALLPAVEDGTVTLVGATTENPFFEVNSPLISRSRVVELMPLAEEAIAEIIKRAVTDKNRGLGSLSVVFAEGSLSYLTRLSGGDARRALNTLETAVSLAEPDEDGARILTIESLEEAIQERAITYGEDDHYDIVSAFIKSIRGSDPDAALYWLARMIYAGEDPKFIARRLVISASEDIGMADSRALEVAIAAARAVEFVGMPEGRINLAHATVYLAIAPKSNSAYLGVDSALAEVKKGAVGRVPIHLQDANYPGAKRLGRGKDYKYPHSFPGHFVDQRYLPQELQGRVFYRPTPMGEERVRVERWRESRRRGQLKSDPSQGKQ